jgi:hypothetical protein
MCRLLGHLHVLVESDYGAQIGGYMKNITEKQLPRLLLESEAVTHGIAGVNHERNVEG